MMKPHGSRQYTQTFNGSACVYTDVGSLTVAIARSQTEAKLGALSRHAKSLPGRLMRICSSPSTRDLWTGTRRVRDNAFLSAPTILESVVQALCQRHRHRISHSAGQGSIALFIHDEVERRHARTASPLNSARRYGSSNPCRSRCLAEFRARKGRLSRHVREKRPFGELAGECATLTVSEMTWSYCFSSVPSDEPAA